MLDWRSVVSQCLGANLPATYVEYLAFQNARNIKEITDEAFKGMLNMLRGI